MVTVRSVADPDAGFAEPLIEAGALAVALGHAIAAAGTDAAVIDADAWGTRLSQRVAAACRVEMSPARRGLPTLIAARGGLGADTIAAHCWTLPPRRNDAGEVMLAAAPSHRSGARFAAEWLAQHTDQLAALGRRFAVVVPLPGESIASYSKVEAVASARVRAVPQRGTAAAGGVRAVAAAFGVRFEPDPVTALHCDGCDTAALLAAVGPVRERVLVGAPARRSERAAVDAVDAAGRALVRNGSLR